MLNAILIHSDLHPYKEFTLGLMRNISHETENRGEKPQEDMRRQPLINKSSVERTKLIWDLPTSELKENQFLFSKLLS